MADGGTDETSCVIAEVAVGRLRSPVKKKSWLWRLKSRKRLRDVGRELGHDDGADDGGYSING